MPSTETTGHLRRNPHIIIRNSCPTCLGFSCGCLSMSNLSKRFWSGFLASRTVNRLLLPRRFCIVSLFSFTHPHDAKSTPHR